MSALLNDLPRERGDLRSGPAGGDGGKALMQVGSDLNSKIDKLDKQLDALQKQINKVQKLNAKIGKKRPAGGG